MADAEDRHGDLRRPLGAMARLGRQFVAGNTGGDTGIRDAETDATVFASGSRSITRVSATAWSSGWKATVTMRARKINFGPQGVKELLLGMAKLEAA